MPDTTSRSVSAVLYCREPQSADGGGRTDQAVLAVSGTWCLVFRFGPVDSSVDGEGHSVLVPRHKMVPAHRGRRLPPLAASSREFYLRSGGADLPRCRGTRSYWTDGDPSRRLRPVIFGMGPRGDRS